MNIKGKKILLITPILFHYHIVLKEELKNLGASVLFFPDQPKDAFTSLKRKLLPNISHLYYNRILQKIKDEKIDLFLLINGKGISREFLIGLKKLNKKAKFITYQWDSITRNNLDRKTNFLYFLDLFDKCYTFDYDDSNKIKCLNYLPNFHTINNNKDYKYNKFIDLLFVATYSDERYKFILKYKDILETNGVSFHYHLYLPWHHFLRFKFLSKKKISRRYISFYTIEKEKIQKLYINSKAVIDIPYKNQTGYTMRIMEGLANKCHVFTTNILIKKEKFYSNDNLSVFKLDDFLENYNQSKKKVFKLEKNSINHLYINNWITYILNN